MLRSLYILLVALSLALASAPSHAQRGKASSQTARKQAHKRAAQKRGKNKVAARKSAARANNRRITTLNRVARRKAAMRVGAKEAAAAPQSPAKVGMVRALLLETPKLTYQALRYHPKQFLRGVFIDGPKHAFHDVKNNKMILALGLTGVALLSGVAEMKGVSIHWPLVGLTTYLVALKNRNVVNRLRIEQLTGADMANTLGAHTIFPAVLTGSASVAGLGVGHGGEAAAAVKAAAAQKFVAGASGGTVIASDGPVLGALLKAEADRDRANRKPTQTKPSARR